MREIVLLTSLGQTAVLGRGPHGREGGKPLENEKDAQLTNSNNVSYNHKELHSANNQ